MFEFFLGFVLGSGSRGRVTWRDLVVLFFVFAILAGVGYWLIGFLMLDPDTAATTSSSCAMVSSGFQDAACRVFDNAFVIGSLLVALGAVVLFFLFG